MTTFGKLRRIVDIREFWKNEAYDFTPWVVENIDLLSEALGVALEVQSSERPIGPFRADIVCRLTSDPDHVVLIENQIERTDHGHLGQLLTYAAGLDAVTIVWIARSFAEEHRAALDWLNGHTDEHLRFFGVEVRLWRIDNSAPAPQFDVISRPNDWSNQTRQSLEGVLTEGQTQQVAFWNALRDYGAEHGMKHVPGTSPKANWVSFGIGGKGIAITMVAARSDPQSLHQVDHLRIELSLNGVHSEHYFNELRAKQAEIEESLGTVPVWYESPGVMQRRIYLWREAPITDPTDWPQQFDWLFHWASVFDQVFRPLVSTLPPPPPAQPESFPD